MEIVSLESRSFEVNGREYVVELTKDGLTTSDTEIVRI